MCLRSAVAGVLLLIAMPLAAQDPGALGAPSGQRADWLQPLLSKRWTGDLDGMIRRRLIRALVVYSQTYYFVDRGTPRGTSYDALKAFETELNRQLKKEKKLPVSVVFLAVRRDQLIPALLEGRGDIAAAGVTITPDRLTAVDFSDPTLAPINEVVVTGPSSPPIATLEDLAAHEIFVRKSTSYYEHLTVLNETLRTAGKAPIRLRLAPESLEDEDLLEMLNAGLVQTLVVDQPVAEFWTKILPNITLRKDLIINSGGEFAWMFRQQSPRLKRTVNAFIKRHPAYDPTRAEILRKYLKSTKFVTDAASPAELRKFQAMVNFFEQYGTQYQVDHLLMMAQGYQESRLDQSVISREGAIGVMQVMPTTGRLMKVGDITKTGPNIHAGIKYFTTVRQENFANQPMDALNRDLFSFAAYNAGAPRINELRQLAKRRGLDPNVWFGNVEIVTSEKIGRETVTYVSNIFKYYVAYALVLETEQERLKAKEAIR